MKPLLAIAFVLITSGCATTRQIDRYLGQPLDVPARAEVSGVPFLEQKRNHCGPASLAMVLRWAGKTTTPDALADKMLTPEKAGTFQIDLVGASRREGFLAIPLAGYDALFRELAAGHPVIVFQNLGVSWFPSWHYAVALGYDVTRKRMLVHSGGNASDDISFRHFDGDWEGGEYWGLVVLPPGELSASGDELAHLTAAAGLERVGHVAEAETSYRKILGKWPRSLGALIGLGNTRYAARDLPGAAEALKTATRFHEKSAASWHNLALVYADMEKKRLAKQSAQKAITLAAPADAEAYRENLRALLR